MTRPECLHSAADNIGDVRYFAVDFKWATCTKCGASIAPEWMLNDANETGDEDVPSPSHGGDDDSNPGCSVDDCWALADVEVSGQPFCGAHAVTPAQAAVLATIDANGGASLISNRTWSSVNTVNWRSVRALERMGILETFLGGDGHYARRTSDPVVTLTLIDGRTYTGTIKSFGATQVSLQTSDGLVTIARSELSAG